ncbi:unnamed protein product [Vicia faba]|uniref:Uncharacterized protein n=1 Tax=Vicia faba TaxID=3906 RepID=A0AAV1A096_VICFA|nr:unnamed protein product [Vicia faba]
MIRTRQGTTTSRKENKSTKKAKKPIVEHKHVTNVQSLKMKGFIIGGKDDVPVRGPPPPMEPPKEVKNKKKVNKYNDHSSKIPLFLSRRTRKATEVSKTQYIDVENFTQTLDSIHVCDKPPRKDDIDNLFNESPISEPVSELVVDTFIYGILHYYHQHTKDSSREDTVASQAVEVNVVVNNDVDLNEEQ